MRVKTAAALLVAALGGSLAVFGWPGTDTSLPYRLDLDVYRLGARALLSGKELYGALPATSSGISLPFTYPPFAAVLFVPLALMPYEAANLTHSLISIGCLWVIIRIVLGRHMGPASPSLILWSAGVFTALLWLEPVGSTLAMGQVNLVLLALIVVDLVASRGRWWQGMLVGLAAAIKLTPLVFLAYFLLNGDRRSLAVALGSFIGFTGLGLVLAPEESVIYWTQAITDPGRIGGLGYVSNQSINGMFVRLVPGGIARQLWFIVCLLLGITVLALLRQLIRRGRDLEGILLLALFSLVASPVSWSHHWVWVVPAILVIAGWPAEGLRPWRALLVLSGVVIFYSRVLWTLPAEHTREQSWTWWQHIVGNAYLIWALLGMVGLWRSLPGFSQQSLPGDAAVPGPGDPDLTQRD